MFDIPWMLQSNSKQVVPSYKLLATNVCALMWALWGLCKLSPCIFWHSLAYASPLIKYTFQVEQKTKELAAKNHKLQHLQASKDYTQNLRD